MSSEYNELKELAQAQADLNIKCEKYWRETLAPKLEQCKDLIELREIHNNMLRDIFPLSLPSVLGVSMVFTFDAMRTGLYGAEDRYEQ